jgi:hypothetical protein
MHALPVRLKMATVASLDAASLYPMRRFCATNRSSLEDMRLASQDSHDRFLATLWFALAIAGFDLTRIP